MQEINKGKLRVPESATMSFKLRFTFWNLATRFPMVEFGPGMMLFASALLAVKLSFLPIWTSQLGPPDCKLKVQIISQNPMSTAVARISKF